MSTTQFGRYVIKGEIGRGGMATVYNAYDPRFEREVAIKVLPHEFLHDPQFRVRFEREAKMIALLEHPAIVPVYDFGEEEGQPFIVMRYMSGGSLSDKLKKGPLPLLDAVQILNRLAPSLDAAHSKGIVHRDLKPGNILFDQYGNAFLSDFGIARLAHAGGGSTLTGTAILGTPAYMSPEQVQGDKEIDGRSDVYAFGVIFFQMLTGQVPYQSDTPAKIMMMHLLEPVPNIRDVKSDVPDGFEAIIEHAMAKDPTQRFQTAGELATAVEDTTQRGEAAVTRFSPGSPATVVKAGATAVRPPVVAGPTIVKPGAPPAAGALPRRRGTPWGIILGGLGALGLLAVLAVAAFFLFGKSLFPAGETATPTYTRKVSTVAGVMATSTPTVPTPTPMPPTDTASPLPSTTSTYTSVPTPTPTATHTPTLEPTITLTPTPTDTPLPVVPVIGGADKFAFLNANNIYVANVDGTDLVQMTFDNAEKKQLVWAPDGQGIIYIVGTRIQRVSLDAQVEVLASFDTAEDLDAFQISPDGTKIAISLNKELFIVPADWEKLKQARSKARLIAMAECSNFAPISGIYFKAVNWSSDGTKIAGVFLGNEAGKRVDVITIMPVGVCQPPWKLDEFPSTRFEILGYEKNPIIQNFGWDGETLFALASYIRNDGYGDLYVYNSDTHQPRTVIPNTLYINPVENICCYRDPTWSPDGSYLMFAFQDIRQGAESTAKLYYIPFGTIGTNATYQPINLPEGFFAKPKEKPQPALRPAK